MLNLRTTLLLTVIIIAVAVLVLIQFGRRSTSGKSSVGVRLRSFALQRDDYTILVGVPLASPFEWQSVSDFTESELTLKNGSVVSYSDVRAFIVAYSNGQLVDSEQCGVPLPASLTGLSPSSAPEHDVIQVADLVQGEQFIQIEHGPSAAHPEDGNHYSTTLTNVTDESVRVDRFAGYAKTRNGWELSTVTNKFYTADEFKVWYGLGVADWIAPGESVADPNNYGGRPMLWAYYCRTKSGQRFIAGKAVR